MLFDDRLSTLLASQPGTAGARGVLWAQLIDLLAQATQPLADEQRARIAELSGDVSSERRLATARAVGSRSRNADLVRIFGKDLARIAAPVMLGAKLEPNEWQSVIAELPAPARALLRQRRDLPREAEDALRRFGHSDFAIPAAGSPEAGAVPENTQIRDMMARIDHWRERRSMPEPVVKFDSRSGHDFRFESDADGAVVWTDSHERAALIGLALADANSPRDFGFDGHATGAFSKRAPFEQARLTLPVNRIWSIAGDPIFRPSDGTFLGYRCFARAMASERAAPPTMQPLPGADALRQLVHELRTPLNAVQGFAAMIEAQMLGPVGQPYRDRAAEIGRDANALLSAIDEIGAWSAIGQLADSSDLAAIIAAVSSDCRAIEERAGATLHYRIAAGLPTIAVEAAAVTRMVSALAKLVLATARRGEQLPADVCAENGSAIVAFGKPLALLGAGQADLLSGEFESGGEAPDTPIFGIAFTLRMVAAQAQSIGGGLDLDGDALVLRLPAAGDSAHGASERF